jgi:hypothetical protein
VCRPVSHRLGHRVGGRRLQPSVCFRLELLQLLPDLGLGPAGHLPPDPRTVRTPAERDRTHPGAVRRIPVDRTLTVPAARSSRHTPHGTPSLALLRGLQDRIWPLTCGAKEHRQGRVDIDPLHSWLRRLQASSWPQLHKPLCSPNRGPRLVHVPDEIHNGWKGQVRPIPENCVACLRKAN